MKRLLVVLVSCAGVACATVPAVKPNGPVALATGSLDAFSPLVAPSAASPVCAEGTGEHLSDGQRAVALVYPESPERLVTVTLDDTGAPIRYMDIRGDVASDGERRGARTTIGLYLNSDYAVLSNRAENDEPVIFEVPLSEALSSDRLGNPDTAIEQVLTTCG